MTFCKQPFAAIAASTLLISAVPSHLAAQQTTKDGVRLENAVNKVPGVDSAKLDQRKSRIQF